MPKSLLRRNLGGVLPIALAAALGGCGESREQPSANEAIEGAERLAERIREHSEESARRHEERMAALLERAVARDSEQDRPRSKRRARAGDEAESAVPVEPLPPFAWGDGLPAILAKLRSLPGSKEIRLRFTECNEPIDLDGASTRQELSFRFEEAFRSCDEQILRCIDTHDALSRRYFGNCDASLTAVVMLAGTPFTLELGLVASAGALLGAERSGLEAMLLEDNAGSYYLPFLLRDLELRTAEPGPFDALQGLVEDLGRRYETGSEERRARAGRYSLAVTDADGRSANVELRARDGERGHLRARFQDPLAGERAEERWRSYLAERPAPLENTEAREPTTPAPQDRLGEI